MYHGFDKKTHCNEQNVMKVVVIFLTLQADFMKMPFPENSFDAVYAIEATCHAPDAVCEILNSYHCVVFFPAFNMHYMIHHYDFNNSMDATKRSTEC